MSAGAGCVMGCVMGALSALAMLGALFALGIEVYLKSAQKDGDR